jgi:hypothetical protein
MNRLVTIAEFANTFDVKYCLLKDMLEEAEIPYILSNANARSVELYSISPSNMSIEVKVYEDVLAEAIEIVKSIQ